MTMEFVPGTTSITIGGTDLTPYIDTNKPIIMHWVDTEEPFPGGFNMKPITLRLKGRSTPALYRVLFGRTHPRIKRMHAAYGRRHGRG